MQCSDLRIGTIWQNYGFNGSTGNRVLVSPVRIMDTQMTFNRD